MEIESKGGVSISSGKSSQTYSSSNDSFMLYNSNVDESLSDAQFSSELEDDFCWITWHCSEKSNGFLVEIDHDYISDSFNLYGLPKTEVQLQALNIVLDEECDLDGLEVGEVISDLSRAGKTSKLDSCHKTQKPNLMKNYKTLKKASPSISLKEARMETEAECLYGMIHARYIVTSQGLEAMREKFLDKDFGVCPRFACSDQAVLPTGLSDTRDKYNVKVFCPNCREIYNPQGRSGKLDGAYFGSTFANLFLMTYPQKLPREIRIREPTVYGFKIHKSSVYWKQLEDRKSSFTRCPSFSTEDDSFEDTSSGM